MATTWTGANIHLMEWGPHNSLRCYLRLRRVIIQINLQCSHLALRGRVRAGIAHPAAAVLALLQSCSWTLVPPNLT